MLAALAHLPGDHCQQDPCLTRFYVRATGNRHTGGRTRGRTPFRPPVPNQKTGALPSHLVGRNNSPKPHYRLTGWKRVKGSRSGNLHALLLTSDLRLPEPGGVGCKGIRRARGPGAKLGVIRGLGLWHRFVLLPTVERTARNRVNSTRSGPRWYGYRGIRLSRPRYGNGVGGRLANHRPTGICEPCECRPQDLAGSLVPLVQARNTAMTSCARRSRFDRLPV